MMYHFKKSIRIWPSLIVKPELYWVASVRQSNMGHVGGERVFLKDIMNFGPTKPHYYA